MKDAEEVMETITVQVESELIVHAIDAADIYAWARVPRGAGAAWLLKNEVSALVEELEGSHDGSTDGRHELTGDKVRAGLALMLQKYPKHFTDLISDNADAVTGDVLIQLALFGDIIYG